jgi:hypothetical protein
MDLELIATLFRIIHVLSGYPIPERFPEVHAVPRDVLQARICPAGCGVKAFYLTDEGVFIDAALDTQNDIVARSVLLHELVHYAQAAAHRFEALSRCAAWHARENEAYQIQNEYLRQQGSAIRQFMPGGIHRCA